jgi:DNA ligase D-like protein (predicted ligase)
MARRKTAVLRAPIRFVEPMECLSVSKLPEGAAWSYEIKLDGYRAQASFSQGNSPTLLSRNGKDLSQRFASILPHLAAAIPHETIIDGELVAIDPDGKPSFGLLQNSNTSNAPIVFFAFDLLQHNGKDLTREPLSERRRLLRKVLRPNDSVQFSESFRISAVRMLQLVRDHDLEGVVAKRVTSPYEAGRRSGAWSKLRVELSQELVIAGYTPGTHGFDALLVGFYRENVLHYCASVRAGFVPASRRQLFSLLKPLKMKACPFTNLPEKTAGRWGQGITAAKMKNCVWLRPETVAQFRFLEWTTNDHLRHASFVGVREDKEPNAVFKEL